MKKQKKVYKEQPLFPVEWLDQMEREAVERRINLYLNDYKTFPLILYKTKDGADVGVPNVIETEEARAQRIRDYVNKIFNPQTIKK